MKKVIVSLTTTAERSDIFYYTLISLLRQSYKPDLISINISRDPFLRDSGFINHPEWKINDNVYINYVKNIGPYRKLLPVLDIANDEDFIVTADDDILYGKDWLKELINYAILNPESIVCCRAKFMKKNFLGNWQNYSNWNTVNKVTDGMYLLPTGGSGVVYKKKLLDLDFLCDEKFLKIAPTTDDLWFRMASLRIGIPVVVFPNINCQNIYLKHGYGLELHNINRPKYNSYLFYVGKKIKLRLYNYFGINISKNDICWDKIYSYSLKKGKNKITY